MIKCVTKSITTCLILSVLNSAILYSCNSSGNTPLDDRELRGVFSVKGTNGMQEGTSSREYFKATDELSVSCKEVKSGDFVQVTFKNEQSAHMANKFRLVKAFKSITDSKKKDEVDFAYYSDGKFYYSDENSTGEIRTTNDGSKYIITFENVSAINIPDKEVKYISGRIEY